MLTLPSASCLKTRGISLRQLHQSWGDWNQVFLIRNETESQTDNRQHLSGLINGCWFSGIMICNNFQSVPIRLGAWHGWDWSQDFRKFRTFLGKNLIHKMERWGTAWKGRWNGRRDQGGRERELTRELESFSMRASSPHKTSSTKEAGASNPDIWLIIYAIHYLTEFYQ